MKIFSIILNDLKIFWKEKIIIICFLVVPPLLIFVFSSIMIPVFSHNSFIKPFSIAVVDYDKSVGSRMAISSLESEGYISKLVTVKMMEENEGIERLKKGEVAGVVVIPEGFAESLYLGKNKPFKVYTNSRQGTSSELIKSFFKNAADLVIAGQSGIYTVYGSLKKIQNEVGITHEEVYKRTENAMGKLMLMAMGRNEVFETEIISHIPQINPLQYYIIGVSILFIMLTGVIGIRLVTMDFETGIIYRIFAAPINKLEYFLAKLITVMFIGFLQFVVIFLPASIFLNSGFEFLNLSAFIVIISVIFASSGFCILISTWVKNSAGAVTGSIIGIFILGLLGGCIYPVASMADWLKTFSEFTISRWGIEGLSWAVVGNNFGKVLNTVGIINLFGLIFISLSLIFVQRGRFKFS